MAKRHLVFRSALTIGLGAAAAAVLYATPARGEPEHLAQLAQLEDEEACMTALKDAKAREQSGKLQEAKTLLRSCARTPCGSFVRRQCANGFNRLDHDSPTVVLLVTDASGAPRTDVQVRIDGVPLTSQLDGGALGIDPGLHDFSFSISGHIFATQKIMIVQGQRNRFISAQLGSAQVGEAGGTTGAVAAGAADTAEPQPPAPARTETEGEGGAKAAAGATAKAAAMPRGVTARRKGEAETAEAAAEPAPESPPAAIASRHPVLPFLLGGVGLASVGAAVLLTTWGRRDNDLLAQCSPSCSPTAVSHIRRLYLEADVALGVGIAALAAGYLVYAVNHSSGAEAPSAQARLRLDLAPTASGGFATLSGGF